MTKIGKRLGSLGCFLIVLAAAQIRADDPMFTGNRLEGLPSPPGSNITAIEALGDNEWLNLGPPAADPDWGVARGRSWGGHSMVLVPYLRGAFYTGEGVHAYVKPDDYGMDDYWFYDINAHAWICLYPGTNTVEFNQQVADGDIFVDGIGRPVNVHGQPVPGHLMIHAWKQMTYDSSRQKIVMFRFSGGFGRYFMPGGALVETGIAALEAQGLHTMGTVFGPWAYDTTTGKFELDTAVNSSPNGPFDYGVFEYISSLGQYFIGDRTGTSFYDPETKTWSAPGPPPPGVGNTYDFSGAYHAERDRLFVAKSESAIWSYDVPSAQWTTLVFPSAYGPINVGPNSGAVTIDTGSGAVLIWDIIGGTLFPFDPETTTFLTPIPLDGSFVNTRGNTNAVFYDPVLRVHFIYTAYDSWDDGEMWVYRYPSSALFSDGFETGDPSRWSSSTR